MARPLEMTFGKYKGIPVSEVIDKHPKYALWAHANVAHFKMSPSEIQRCIALSDAPSWFPRSPTEGDHHGGSSDEWGGMSYGDFGNN